MTEPAAPLPCVGSEHLTLLVDELDRATARLRSTIAIADPAAVAARRADEDAVTAEATLRLDGGLRASEDGGTERAGTWLDALGGDDGVDEATLVQLSAREHAGVTAGVAATDLADAFGRANADAGGLGTALAMLHARLTVGLVAPERAGMLRRGPRVVHDASVGKVLFFPTDAALLADAWDGLLRHVTGSGAGGAAARLPAAVRAGVLHLELLRHQPFDAANGRLARAAGRLALIADGLMPEGLGAPDAVLAEDPLGYHEEVGASLRRRDATRWIERLLEAQGIALQRSIAALDGATSGTPAESIPDERVPDGLKDGFTLGDVVELTGASPAAARAHCSTWVVSGQVQRVVGSGGLRFSRPA